MFAKKTLHWVSLLAVRRFRWRFFFVLGHLLQFPERKPFMDQQRHARKTNAANVKPNHNRRRKSRLFFIRKILYTPK